MLNVQFLCSSRHCSCNIQVSVCDPRICAHMDVGRDTDDRFSLGDFVWIQFECLVRCFSLRVGGLRLLLSCWNQAQTDTQRFTCREASLGHSDMVQAMALFQFDASQPMLKPSMDASSSSRAKLGSQMSNKRKGATDTSRLPMGT